ncbi:Zinc transporter like [Quillaja saponaria]|uniref:Zinc transporter like n=1 Tax=Quillaja saponaria TaxID=32244 RepID=A0AAD7LT36_QUISA|nr:Zinc transporter like [Quillaja saponaria]
MSRSLCFFLFFLFFILSVSAHSGHHDEDEDAGNSNEVNQNLRSKSLILVKILCLAVIFFGTFVAGVSPYVLRWNEGFLVLGTQFAGGVFLGTAMMHFLSDANEMFEELTKKKYPFAFMLACAGYLIIMLGDCLISYVFAKRDGGSDSRADVEIQGVGTGQGSPNGQISQSQYQVHKDTHHHFANSFAPSSSIGDTVLLIVALCFHSVFEGIAIGVSKTNVDTWKALWTISLHKIFAAIAMGIALLRMIPDRPLLSCATYAFAFAISSPVGVSIGIVIDATTQGAVADWIFAISMGLACGVFIYVAINHLLSKGYTPQKRIKVDTPHHKFLAVLVGVGVIAVVMLWDT